MKKAILYFAFLLSFHLLQAQYEPCDYSAPCYPAPFGMTAWWSGDVDFFTISNVAEDLTGSHTGTIMGSGSFYSPLGKVCPAFFMNGFDNYVSVPDDPAWNFGTNDFSIEFWVQFFMINPGIIHPYANTLIAQSNGIDDAYWILYTNGQSILLDVKFVGQTVRTFATSTPANFIPGSWCHIALTRSGDTFTFYINGAVISSDIKSGSIMPDVAAPLTIGYSYGGPASSHLSGMMDELSIYSRSLTATEIAGIFSAGCKGKCKNTCPPATISASGPLALCQGQSVTLTANPEGAYYSWSTGANTREILVDEPGPYFVTVVCSNGCIEMSEVVMVTESPYPAPALTLSPDVTITAGQNATLSASVVGSAPSYSFLWSTGETSPEITVSPETTTTYSVTVSDQFSCAVTGSVTVTVEPGNCENYPCGNNKVLICHIPPGNPAKARTLCVSKNAVAGHLEHGDYCGPCLNGKDALALDGLAGSGIVVDEVFIEVHPNPFAGRTRFDIAVPESTVVELDILNVFGNRVAHVFSGRLDEGNLSAIEFDAWHLSRGLYFYRLTTSAGKTVTGKLILQ